MADATGIRVARIRDVEASSLGVAKLLAYRDGVISRDELGLHPDVYRVFVPSISDKKRTRLVEVYESLLESYLTASCLSRSSC